MCTTTEFAAAMPHGPVTELFPEVFFLTGTMRAEFGGSPWQFSRNMVILREGTNLTLVNTVRLSEAGLAQLNRLGKVTQVVKIGSMHGMDDPFYVQHYGATFWAMPGMTHKHGLQAARELRPGGDMPVAGCSMFQFETTKIAECILRLDREGGILIACDALQNWIEPDEYFSPESAALMRSMGFFQKANLGPVWVQSAAPAAGDFRRLKELPFRHALCGHGDPLLHTAQEDYAATFQRIFQI